MSDGSIAHNEQGFVSVWEFEKLMLNNLQKMNRINNVENIGVSPNSTKPPVVGSTVILGDCVEVMKGFEDNQFDLAIVDPPYGIVNDTKATGFKNDTFANIRTAKEWDIKPVKEYWSELFRISKNQIIWGFQYFIEELPSTKSVIIWDKMNGENFMNDAELAWSSCKGNNKIFKHAYIGRYNPEPIKIHPTQKPVKLYEWVLKTYATEGMKVIDTHLGSGSSRIAADKAGLDFTGIEIDKEYFDLSEKRFKQYKSQLRIEGW